MLVDIMWHGLKSVVVNNVWFFVMVFFFFEWMLNFIQLKKDCFTLNVTL